MKVQVLVQKLSVFCEIVLVHDLFQSWSLNGFAQHLLDACLLRLVFRFLVVERRYCNDVCHWRVPAALQLLFGELRDFFGEPDAVKPRHVDVRQHQQVPVRAARFLVIRDEFVVRILSVACRVWNEIELLVDCVFEKEQVEVTVVNDENSIS